ncbi:MAG: Hsp70 family protein [Deltaproteobacteria bacterium]|nr:Hsp70 family protein [Deltaproteobacteria bacterium]
MKPILGIDFGTSNSAAAWVDATGQVHAVPVREDSVVLPSVVCYHQGGSVLVGHAAREMVVDQPQNTISDVKRFLGRMFLSDFVGRNRGRFLFNLVEGEHGLTGVEIFGQRHSAEEVAYHILARVVELANIAAGIQFEECVLAVPAHYTFRQRQVLRAVAERLLTVKAMVNEPTAASLLYAKRRGEVAENTGPIFVYDLGGGTFDATLLKVKRGLVEVLSTGGDAFLGGNDFDARLVEFLLERFEVVHPDINLRDDPMVMQRLKFAAEKAKIDLSVLQQTKVRLPCVMVKEEEFIDLDIELSRRELEDVTAPLIERTLGAAEEIVRKAGLSPEDVADMVLVGGQTQMPRLRTRMGQIFHLHNDNVSPETAVAMGAALFGRGVHILVDVLAVPVCVMLPGVGPKEAIPKNIALPCVRRVPLPARPPEGKPLAMVFYEALDLTSIDRDILGTVKIPPEWLEKHSGDLALEIRMSASFGVEVFVHAASGGRLALPLEIKLVTLDIGKKRDKAPEKTEYVARENERIEVNAQLTIRGPAGPLLCRTENLSKSGLFAKNITSFQERSRVQVELTTPSRMLSLPGEVIRVVEEGESGPGMAIRFVDVPQKMMTMLSAYVDQLAAGTAGAQSRNSEGASVGPNSVELSRLKRFLQGVAQNKVYDALDIAPLATSDEMRKRIIELKEMFVPLEKSSPPKVAQRVGTALQILERTSKMLLDPWRRLHFDFKNGRVFPEERIAQATASGLDISLLREAWRRAHPEKMDQALMLRAQATVAAGKQDFRTAADVGTRAMKEDPFDLQLRTAVMNWRRQGGM